MFWAISVRNDGFVDVLSANVLKFTEMTACLILVQVGQVLVNMGKQAREKDDRASAIN